MMTAIELLEQAFDDYAPQGHWMTLHKSGLRVINLLPEIIKVLRDTERLVEFYKKEGTEHGFEDNIITSFEALNTKAGEVGDES